MSARKISSVDRQKATEITHLLRAWSEGSEPAKSTLIERIYNELHTMAERSLRSEDPNHTLQPTALVNELYLRLANSSLPKCRDRAHFLAIAAQTFRRILIDYARAQRAARRGGHAVRLPLESVQVAGEYTHDELLEINEALEALKDADPRAVAVVEMRFFGGLEEREIAEVLGVSEITVKRDWKFARSWLLAHLSR